MTLVNADVIVVGAGPAGASCAAELARLGAEVLLVHDPRHPHDACETLQPGSTAVVTSILGNVLDAPHESVAGVRSAWGSADLVETNYLRDPSDDAWAVDRQIFDQQARAAAIIAGARIWEGRLTGLDRQDAIWRIDLADHTRLHTRFVVDATGRGAFLARRMGHHVVRHDSLVAMVADCQRAADAPPGTTVEATPTGWWYATVLGERASLGFVTDADLLPRADRRSADWSALLQQTTYMRHLVQGSPVFARTVRADTTITEAPCGDGWLAVGDAAAGWDPLSSQGLIVGILMAGRAARAISAGVGAIAEWSADLRMLAEDTRALQATYYDAERRWRDSPFWARRAVSGSGA